MVVQRERRSGSELDEGDDPGGGRAALVVRIDEHRDQTAYSTALKSA